MSSTSVRRPTFAFLALLVLIAGCTEVDDAIIGVKKEGESCKQVSDCVAGLDCLEGVCLPFDPLFTGPQRGDPCTTDADCGPDLVCGRQDVCTLSKGAPLNSPCGLTIECVDPLICNGVTGVCSADSDATCAQTYSTENECNADPGCGWVASTSTCIEPGSRDFGESCSEINDCRRPYVCNLDHVCDQLPLYTGPDCTASDTDGGAFRVFFEIPESPVGDPHEFYRLPFPSDIRAPSGQISLEGHASPNRVLGIGVPENYIQSVEEDADGFAVNQPIFLRFSNAVDPTTVCLDAGGVYPEPFSPADPPFCEAGGAATVYLVQLDTNERIPVQLAMSREKGQYICQNWLGVAPLDGRPLDHDTTFAVVITTGVMDVGGSVAVRDSDFDGIMTGATNVPAMQPLLDWVSAESIDASSIAGATVFTTGNPDALAGPLRTAVRDAMTPTFGAEHVCGTAGTAPDPCAPSEPDRGCLIPAASVPFTIVQGTYDAPYFQAGTRPFLTAADGGAFVLDGNGDPVSQGTETMCYALAHPSGAGPFPVVIYAHGTGGNYRGFLDQTLGDGVTTLAGALTNLGYAVIGFDNVMHGPRQQDPGATLVPAAWQDPGRLFFNLANPRAARDNVLQGAADLFHLTHLLGRYGASGPPGPNGIRFDETEIYFLGHSQGTVIAPAFLAAEPELQAAVLSGAGAELALSVLNKKQPMDVSVIASAFFADEGITRIHPMMGIMAMLFGPADSVSYAPTWIDPTGANLPLMQFTGIGDSFTPDITQHAQIRAAGLPLVGAVNESIDGVEEVGSPRARNGAVQFPTDGIYDGHFVMFQNPTAQSTLTHFFQTALTGTPEVQR